MYTAKDKLNAVAIRNSMIVAGLTAMIFQSWFVGMLSFGGCMLSAFYGGSFRIPESPFQPGRRLRRRR